MATRTIKFSYNGYEPSFPIAKYTRNRSYDKTTFTWQFLITAADEDALKTAVEAAVTALTPWNKTLVITEGSSTITYSHSANTGFLARTNVTKIGAPFDTCRSQLIQFSAELVMPADASGYGGRRQSTINVTREPNEAYSVAIQAEYTALATPASVEATIIANFQTYADAEMVAIASALGITNYETVEKVSYNREGENKVGQCNIRYQEVLYDEITSGQSSQLVMVSFSVRVDELSLGTGVLSSGVGAGSPAPNPSGKGGKRNEEHFVAGSKVVVPNLGDVPPVRFSATYVGIVPKSATDDEREIYITYVEAFMSARLSIIAGLGNPHNNIYVESRSPEFNPHRRTISVTWTGLILGLNKVESYSEVLTLSNNNNIISEKVRDGVDDTHSVFYLGRTLTAVHTVNIRSYDILSSGVSGSLSGAWIKLGDTQTIGPIELVGLKESKVSTGKRKIYYNARRYSTSFLTNYLYAIASTGRASGGRGPVITDPGRRKAMGKQPV